MSDDDTDRPLVEDLRVIVAEKPHRERLVNI